MRFKMGYRMMTLGWSDGNTFLAVNSCLFALSKDSNIIGPVKKYDKRSLAGKRRALAQKKGTEVMLTLLDKATASGLTAKYVLFDRWFSNPAQILDIKSRDMDVTRSSKEQQNKI